MAVFIKQDNQRILWNTIQNLDLFHLVLTDAQKPLWFKEIIGIFYEKCRDRRLSRVELENLNRQVVEYMVSSLKMLYVDMKQKNANSIPSIQKSAIAQSAQKRVSFQENVGMESAQASSTLLDFRPEFSSNLEKKAIQSQQYVSEFSTRQQEYEQMMKKETPPDVNFKEEISDDIIRNMDELLEKQRKQRELDLQVISSSMPIITSESIPHSQTTNNIYGSKRKLIFKEDKDENISPIDISVLELQNPVSYTFEKNMIQILEELKKEILDIRKILENPNPNMKDSMKDSVKDSQNLH